MYIVREWVDHQHEHFVINSVLVPRPGVDYATKVLTEVMGFPHYDLHVGLNTAEEVKILKDERRAELLARGFIELKVMDTIKHRQRCVRL